jgi:hypothetical protein
MSFGEYFYKYFLQDKVRKLNIKFGVYIGYIVVNSLNLK